MHKPTHSNGHTNGLNRHGNGHNSNGHSTNGHADVATSDVWQNDARWAGITRTYTMADVARLRGSLRIEYTLARHGAERLWSLLNSEKYVHALGAITGNQAIQQVQAGLKAIYMSGWQVAADGNAAGQMYPDQSLYPSDSVPAQVRKINQALQRADQIHHSEGKNGIDWFAPIVADAEAGFGGTLNAFELMKGIVADAEAGFGGTLNAFELMKGMIEAGAAGVHFEDQLSSVKKCGHMGGKVLVPTREFIQKLIAARLATDVMGVSTILVARTDANSAGLITSDVDPRDQKFIFGERTEEGFFQMRGGLDAAIARGLAYAPYADMIWCETSEPNLDEARRFAAAIHAEFPGKLLAYNCSPSFNWQKKLSNADIATFQQQLGEMGYKFQFVTLAGFHALNHSMFELAQGYAQSGMAAYSRLQQAEFASEAENGYRAVKHQQFVGTKYFDDVAQCVASGKASTVALKGSTEEEQFSELPHEQPESSDSGISAA